MANLEFEPKVNEFHGKLDPQQLQDARDLDERLAEFERQQLEALASDNEESKEDIWK